VTDVDRAAQGPALGAECRPQLLERRRGFVSHHERRSPPHGGLVGGDEGEPVGRVGDTGAAEDAAPAVERDTTLLDLDCAGGAELHEGLGRGGRGEHFDAAPEAGRSLLGPRRVAGRDDAVAQAPEQPLQHQRSAPAGVRPKLCSMKETSVSTSPR
jgi:hypothetical protein